MIKHFLFRSFYLDMCNTNVINVVFLTRLVVVCRHFCMSFYARRLGYNPFPPIELARILLRGSPMGNTKSIKIGVRFYVDSFLSSPIAEFGVVTVHYTKYGVRFGVSIGAI